MTRSTGIRTLHDLRDRCRINAETGCWLWTLAVGKNGVPVGHMAGENNRRQYPARRLAWILSGKPLRDGQAVYLAQATCGKLCCNPDHCGAGSKGMAQRAAAERGAFDTAHRRAQLKRACAHQMLPADVVLCIAEDIADGWMTAKLAAEMWGIDEGIAQRIRRGEHAHQRPQLLTGASVFALPVGRAA